MQQHPANARIAPWAIYMVLMVPVTFASDDWAKLYPLLYLIQCAATVWMLWRYRSLMPELTLRCHWLSLVAGLGVAWLWVVIGKQMVTWFPNAFADTGATPFFQDDQMGPVIGWIAMSLRLLGMSLVVPMFEELFNRSLLLRCLRDPRKTFTGLLQIAQDFPVIGDWLMHTGAGIRADKQKPAFTEQLNETPFGQLTVFSVLASTFVFMLVHHPRDWPACFLCGVIYCLVVGATRRHGLGPVIWAHGVTNAALWVYTIHQHYRTAEGSELWPFL
ncbi:MAG: hypothetical protein CMJ18_06270 [Phycisphaeraceae bacterium]|nr:hypothetical protein [Phycisphaeraceae bacterium]